MRITGGRLIAFGAYTNRDLPALGPGLTVVFGENESGKSTLLQFVRQMLFGFARADTAEGMAPIAGGQPAGLLGLEDESGRGLEIERRGMRAAFDVRLAGGGAISGEEFGRLFGGIDKAAYNTLFAIDLDDLASREALSSPEVERLVYGASLGVSPEAYQRARGSLAKQADDQFRSTRAQKELNRLHRERDQLRTQLRDARRQLDEYHSAVAQEAQLTEALGPLRRANADAQLARARAERLLKAWPVWVRAAEAKRALDAMGDAPAFPFADHAQEWAESTRRLAQLDEDAAKARAALAALRAQMDGLTRRPELMAARLELMELREPARAAREARASLGERTAALDAAREDAAQALRKLGVAWSEDDARAVNASTPTRVELAERKARMQTAEEAYRRAGEKERQLARDAAEAELAVMKAQARVPDAPGKAPLAASLLESLRASRDRVRADLDEAPKEDARLSAKERELADGLAAISPDWVRSDLDSFPKEIVEHAKANEYAGAVVEATAALAAARAKCEGLDIDSTLAQQPATVGVRWPVILVCQFALVAFLAQLYAPEEWRLVPAGLGVLLVVIAVVMFMRGRRLSVDTSTSNPLATMRQSAEAAIRRAEEELEHREEMWQAWLVTYGLPEATPPRLLDTIRARVDSLRSIARDVDELQSRSDERERRVEALAALARDASIDGYDAPAELVSAVSERLALEERNAKLRADIERAEADVAAARVAHAAAVDAHDAAMIAQSDERRMVEIGQEGEREWLDRVGLALASSLAEAEAILLGIDAWKEKDAQATRAAAAVEDARRAIAACDAKARATLEPLALWRADVSSESLVDAALAALRDAESAEQHATKLQLEAAGPEALLREIAAEREEIASRRAALLAESGCGDSDSFSTEVKRAVDRREATTRLERDLSDVCVLSGIADRAEAIEALADATQEALERAFAEAMESATRATAEQEAAVGQLGDARRRRETLEKSTDVGRLRLEEESITARMQESWRTWARATLAGWMLDRAKDEFERTRQPAVLAFAGQALATITRGRWTRVYRPIGSGADALMVVSADGSSECELARLSRGTREQLFLALRIGTIRHFVEGRPAPPIVLDDVLVNFDDVRAERALEALGELGQSAQVLLFSCHRRVRDAAQRLGIPVADL